MRVIAAGQRFASDYHGIRTDHGYSAGPHYDPQRLGFGALIGYDEHLLAPGVGFDRHRHRDVDIVSWVLEGVLEHSDDAGRVTLVRPGDVQVQHCGTGILHTERNASHTQPLRFLQLAFHTVGKVDEPAYRLVENVGDALVPVGACVHGVPSLQALALPVAAVVAFPAGMQLHVHVTRGCAHVAGQRLSSGDSAELGERDPVELTAGEDGSEVLVIRFSAG